MLYFILGIIVGLLLRTSQNALKDVPTVIRELRNFKITDPDSKAQIVPAVTRKQRLEQAQNIDDLIEPEEDFN